MANEIQQEKIYSKTGLTAGASQTITWKNPPQQTPLSFWAAANPPTAAGPHGTSHGAVEITGVVHHYDREQLQRRPALRRRHGEERRRHCHRLRRLDDLADHQLIHRPIRAPTPLGKSPIAAQRAVRYLLRMGPTRTPSRVFGLVAVVVVALAGLTACDPGPGSPVADPTVHRPPASHSASGTPSAAVTTNPLAPSFIEVNAHSVSVGAANESQLIEIPFTTAIATAASQLSATIGVEPTVTPVAATGCAPATARYDWGGVVFYTDVPWADSLGASYLVSVTTPTTRDGLRVEAAGQTVGTSLADVLAHVPGSASGDRGEGHIEAVVDPQADASWGVIMHVHAGTISDFIAPGQFIFGHGTC